jgi:hypothetical protein
MIDNRTQVFDVAMKNARTIEACVDRLAMMGADHELKLIARRLSRLTFRAAPSGEAMSTPRELRLWRCAEGPPGGPQCFKDAGGRYRRNRKNRRQWS